MRITDILSLSAVKVPLASIDKRAIIDELVDTLATAALEGHLERRLRSVRVLHGA